MESVRTTDQRRGVPARRRLLTVAAALLALTGCAGPAPQVSSSETADGSTPLHVMAFTSAAAGWNASLPAFADTEAGSGIDVRTTYATSAEVAKAILDGEPADIVYLAEQASLDRLIRQEKVAAEWDDGPYQGKPFHSVATLVVREGNPRNIRSWADLLRPGIQVVAANPVLSGSGKWGLIAAYANASDGGANPDAGIDYLNKLIFEHVVEGPTTVPESIELFLAGTGDVLLAPENAALDAQRRSPGLETLVPDRTLQIDNEVAVLRTSEHPDDAARLVNFLYTPEAQRLWAEAGFRPVLPEVTAEFAADFPQPQTLWTIDQIGGWAKLDPLFFDSENGIITKIFDQATA